MTDKMYAFLFGCAGMGSFTNALNLLINNDLGYGVTLLVVAAISLGVGIYISFRKGEK